jgi:hypothetical protein
MPADFIKKLAFASHLNVQKDVFRPKVFGDGAQWIPLKVMFRRPTGLERIYFNSVLIHGLTVTSVPYSQSAYAKQQ